MTLDKAIETLKDATVGTESFDDPELPDAIKLGIEAMRRIKEVRRFPRTWDARALPGETEE